MGDRVVIVGGGLAGLAAAAALAPRGFAVTLLESRPRLGGRASSFVDAATGERIDNCQHVAFGCCTNYLHFCRTIGRETCFRREQRLTFVAPDGTGSDLAPSRLPAPLHLLPAFVRLGFLTLGEKWRLALGLAALARTDPAECGGESFHDWLRRHRQPAAAVDRFWGPVVVSALSDTLDKTDVGHARKVFVDLLLRNRAGWEMFTPTVPLDELYGDSLAAWFARHGVVARLLAGASAVHGCNSSHASEIGGHELAPVSPRRLRRAPAAASERNPSAPGAPAPGRLATTVEEAEFPAAGASGVELRSGEFIPADYVILAVPHTLMLDLLPEEWRVRPEFAGIAQLETAPISSVHLWFDRPITELSQATFVDRLSQWVFYRDREPVSPPRLHGASSAPPAAPPLSGDPRSAARTHYYQIVISASHGVAGQLHEETIRCVVAELAEVWPRARDAQLVHSRLVTEHKAVVSIRPGVDGLRPAQQTSIPNLYLAGDWTRTGWPSTMEGAVRSGYLAAQCILSDCGRPESLVQPDLPTALLSRLLLGL